MDHLIQNKLLNAGIFYDPFLYKTYKINQILIFIISNIVATFKGADND